LLKKARTAIATTDGSIFIWAACDKDDVRTIRSLLKQRHHGKQNMNVAWYWTHRSRLNAAHVENLAA
jgi:NADPH-dependent ferric siderophore reductase